ncbi:MAG TPA: 30S ribosomal protein S11 [Candidatus Nanoarchaeia archaeon]|nr:30S ribosomal protein S11 [Candidatus Nanoarchaeia archaeon]
MTKEKEPVEAPIENLKETVENSKETKKEETTETPVETPKEPKKEEKEERTGIVYIYSSQNNTIIHITDMVGNTLSRVSGGMVTKHDRLKSDPTIAMFVAKRAAERAKDLGITSLYIRMRGTTGSTGTGPGAHAAVKSLSKEGFKIINILDTTRVARGGPKKKGGKRGRRV